MGKMAAEEDNTIYDFEDNSMNFGRFKATNMKGNKRVHLPKAGSPSLEAFLEIRRQEASRIFDECLKILEEGGEKEWDNLDHDERLGIKSLQKKGQKGETDCMSDR